MALDIDTDGFRRASELVDAAGTVLNHDLGEDVAACGGDEVSADADGKPQHAARLVGSACARRLAIRPATPLSEWTPPPPRIRPRTWPPRHATPAALARRPPTPSVAAPGMHAASPTGSPPQSAIPDISGRDGEQLARALESGAGPGPAAAAAARLNALAAQATAANTTLVAAHTQLLASGESAAH